MNPEILDTYDVETICIKKINESFCWVDASSTVTATLSDHFSFYAPGYQFHPKVRARMWDGRIRLFNSRFNTLPLGLVGQLQDFLEEGGATLEFEGFPPDIDKEALGEDFDRFTETLVLPDGMEIRDYQRQAAIDSLASRRGIIISPTGSGKSLIIYLILRYALSRGILNKVLLIVPTINLVTQMYKDFKSYSRGDDGFIVEDECHQIYGGRDKTFDKRITISTWQSMNQIKGLKHYSKFDGILVDEAHLAEGATITKILEASTNASYKIGLTGTLKESKQNPLALVGLFGEVIKTRKTHELMADGLLTATPVLAMVLKHSDADKKNFWEGVKELKKKKQNKKVFAFEQKYLLTSPRRNKVILRLCQMFKEMNTLILFRNLEHIDQVQKILEKAGLDVKRMSSDMSAEERDAIREYCENNDGVVVLSTYQMFQLGINIKNLHNGILGAPAKGRIRVLQSFGRIIRQTKDGRVGYLVDLMDDIRLGSLENHLWKHAVLRLQYYKEEKLKIKYKKVNL